MLKESDDLDIWGVTFNFKITFDKHHCSVSRVASHRLGIIRKSWRLFRDISLIGSCFRGFLPPVLEDAQFCSVVFGCRYTPQLLNSAVSAAWFLTGAVF